MEDSSRGSAGIAFGEEFAAIRIRSGKDVLTEDGNCVSCGAAFNRPHKAWCQDAQECDRYGS